jgi:hypothetical protein
MCDKCQQLQTDIQRYRKRLRQSRDPLTIEIQRSRRLLALGLDPLTIGRIEGAIHELIQDKPAYAQTANRSPPGTSTGFSVSSRQEGAGLPARVLH